MVTLTHLACEVYPLSPFATMIDIETRMLASDAATVRSFGELMVTRSLPGLSLVLALPALSSNSSLIHTFAITLTTANNTTDSTHRFLSLGA